MEKKWTPGPWCYGEAHNYHGYHIAPVGTLPTLAACERFGETITVHCFNFPGSTEDNARLMSSSPELYDALEDCEYWLSAPPTSQSDRECVANVIKRARAVMAKARGENAKQETP